MFNSALESVILKRKTSVFKPSSCHVNNTQPISLNMYNAWYIQYNTQTNISTTLDPEVIIFNS